MEKNTRSTFGNFGLQQWDSLFAICLHHGLYSVNWRQENSHSRCPQGCEHSLSGRRQGIQSGVAFKECQDSCISKCVTETTQRTLQQCWPKASVQTSNSSFCHQFVVGTNEGSTISVLVVHDGAHPHQ